MDFSAIGADRRSMGLARCQRCGTPHGKKQSFAHQHAPLSYPDKRILCGTHTCAAVAFLWLTDEEEKRYAEGQRNFRVPGQPYDVQVV